MANCETLRGRKAEGCICAENYNNQGNELCVLADIMMMMIMVIMVVMLMVMVTQIMTQIKGMYCFALCAQCEVSFHLRSI